MQNHDEYMVFNSWRLRAESWQLNQANCEVYRLFLGVNEGLALWARVFTEIIKTLMVASISQTSIGYKSVYKTNVILKLISGYKMKILQRRLESIKD